MPNFVTGLDRTLTAYGMEINNTEKIMTNHPNGFRNVIKVKDHKLKAVNNFKYLGATVTDEGSKKEIIAIAQATASLTKLKVIWKYRNISNKHKFRLLSSLVISTFLYACKTWTLTADLQRRI